MTKPTPTAPPTPQSPTRRALALSAASGLLLAACGGGGERVAVLPGGGGSGSPVPTPTPSRETAALHGAITALSPLSVNGMVVSNVGSSPADPALRVTLEDDLGGGLKLGMVVTITGTFERVSPTDNAASAVTATELSARADVRGRVESVTADVIVVAGQRVQVHAGTVLAGLASLAQLRPGDSVQVHGLPQAQELSGVAGFAVQNLLWATRIEKLARTDLPTLLLGGVQPNACDTCAPNPNLFRINSTVVQTSPVALNAGISLPLEPGSLVRVTENMLVLPPVTMAQSVRPYFVEPLANSSAARVQGFVTRRLDGSLRIASVPLQIDSSIAASFAALGQEWRIRPVELHGSYSPAGFIAFAVTLL